MEVGTAELGGMQSTVQSCRDEMRKAKAHLELNKVMLWLKTSWKLSSKQPLPFPPLPPVRKGQKGKRSWVETTIYWKNSKKMRKINSNRNNANNNCIKEGDYKPKMLMEIQLSSCYHNHSDMQLFQRQRRKGGHHHSHCGVFCPLPETMKNEDGQTSQASLHCSAQTTLTAALHSALHFHR